MPSNFVASFEFVVGSNSSAPYSGVRDGSRTTSGIQVLANVVDPIMPSTTPAGNTAILLANASGTCLLKPIEPPAVNSGHSILTAIGLTLDGSVSIFQSTGVPPTIAQVTGIYTGVSASIPITPASQVLHLTIPRYVTASFTGGEG